MKKKLMMVAVLLGALTLGACVDDNESASVTAVRNAKAKQLESVAAMNNATAEATAKLAEAEAALKIAQAKAAEIEAERAAVEVELAKVQLESEKARLEGQLAQLEVEKAQAKAEMETIAANLEAELLNAKAALLRAQIGYNNSLKDLNDQEKAKLGELLTVYTDASNSLLEAQQELAQAKIELAGLESGLVTAQEQAKIDSVNAYKNIDRQKAMIEVYKQYETIPADKAWDAYIAANDELNVLYNKSQATNQTLIAARQDHSKANDLLYQSTYYQKLRDNFMGWSYQGIAIRGFAQMNNKPWNNYAFGVTDPNTGITTWTPMFSTEVTESVVAEWTNDNGTYGGMTDYNKITKFYELDDAGFTAFFAALEKAIKDNQGKNYTDAKKAYDDAVIEEAAAKVKAEKEGATDADKQAYYVAQNNTLMALNFMNYCENEKTEAEEELAELKAVYAVIAEQAEAVKTMVENYNKTSEASQTAYIAYQKAGYNVSIKRAEVSALQNIYNNATDIEGFIADCEKEIVSSERELANIPSNYVDEQNSIAYKKSEIADLETVVAVREKEAAAAKAELDAAMAAQ